MKPDTMYYIAMGWVDGTYKECEEYVADNEGVNMNERIKELLVEAGVYECDDFEPHPTFEKFAELIVKECAGIAGKAEYSDTWSEPVEDTIKKHFGVEE